ncbi:hypothetical protein D3C78_1747810 [compost metagenome]
MAQKVAKPAARLGGVDNRTGYLRAAVVYRDSKFPLRSLFLPLQGVQPGGVPVYIYRSGLLQGAEKRIYSGFRPGGDRHSAGGHSGLFDGQNRLARSALY